MRAVTLPGLPMSPDPHLLSPLRIAGVTLPNRMVMGAMHTRLETLDRPLQRLAAFYATRAAGEIALILTGGYSPVPEGVMDEGGLVLDSADGQPLSFVTSRKQLPEPLPPTTATVWPAPMVKLTSRRTWRPGW